MANLWRLPVLGAVIYLSVFGRDEQQASTGKLLAQSDSPPRQMAQLRTANDHPIAPKDSDCYHPIPDHALVLHDGQVIVDNKVVDYLPNCTPEPPVTGIHVPTACRSTSTNVEFAYGNPPSGFAWINGLAETMWVPNAPTGSQSGNTVALWNGIEGNNTVIQPVLIYNVTGMPNQWLMITQMATGEAGTTQGGTPVNPGDRIDTDTYADPNQPCANPNTGAGCTWWAGYSINYGTWHWFSYNPPSSEAIYQGVLGSLEPGTESGAYFCDDLPPADGSYGADFQVQGAYVPSPDYHSFNGPRWDYGFQPLAGCG